MVLFKKDAQTRAYHFKNVILTIEKKKKSIVELETEATGIANQGILINNSYSVINSAQTNTCTKENLERYCNKIRSSFFTLKVIKDDAIKD